MKKIIFALVALLMCGLIIIACAPEKRSKLRTTTITVSVEPLSAHLNNGESKDFTAIIRNNGIEVDGDVFWRVEPAEFGTFSSTTSKTTTFTAAATGSGNGQIIAECSGVKGYSNIALGAAVVIDNIQITVDKTSLNNGETANLSAQARAGTTVVDPQPTINWTINPTDLGVLSSTTGANVTFTADSVKTGDVTVTASVGSASDSKTITVGSSVPPTGDKLLIYNDAGLGSLVKNIYHWDIGKGGSVSDMIKKTDGDGVTGDASEYQTITYNGQGWTEWAFVFNGTQDLSEYNKMIIHMRSSTPNAAVRIQFMRDSQVLAGENTGSGSWPALASTWYKYEIDISAVSDKTGILNPVVICLSTGIGNFNGSFDIDYIYFEK